MSSEKQLNVFVSYSHKDTVWLERVRVRLTPLAREGRLDLWDDNRIRTGQRWRDEISAALARADVAVLLISADFYASDFIANKELLPLLEASRSARGLVICGVHISYSRFDRDEVLSEYQTVNTPDQPIEGLSKAQQDKVFNDLARLLEELVLPERAFPEKRGLDGRHERVRMEGSAASERSIHGVAVRFGAEPSARELPQELRTSRRHVHFPRTQVVVLLACLVVPALVAASYYMTAVPNLWRELWIADKPVVDVEQAEGAASPVARLLGDLKSGETAVRREARSALAKRGATVVPSLLDELSANRDSYPTRLGVSVALAEMLRRGQRQGPQIRALLDEEDLALLADAAADDDPNLRTSASGFLQGLADPRVVNHALKRIPAASDDSKYELVLVIKGAFGGLPRDEQERVARELKALKVDRKTRELIDSFAT